MQITNNSITVRNYEDENVFISESNTYKILLLNHNGTIRLNFETLRTNGRSILFLCPNEVVEILDCTQLRELSIIEEFGVEYSLGFTAIFGNIKKLFSLQDKTYSILDGLFDSVTDWIKKSQRTETDSTYNPVQKILGICHKQIVGDYCPELHFVYSFIRLVHENYTMHHDMSYYSRLLGVSAKRISEKFNSLGIMPPHTFIRERIICEAKRQLLYTNKTVKLICFDVGFNDPAYFARFFKKNTGMITTQFVSYYKQLIAEARQATLQPQKTKGPFH